MITENIILSILVISHNQEALITRCLTSILRQKLNVTYEIIISDDASTDNTWNVIQEYMNQYPDIIFGYQINSDDCKPINRSERCGFNKANAYKQSRGKYFVNIDADDFLLNDDIYQLQVHMLEKHTDCVMCMQNVSIFEEGSPLVFKGIWFQTEKVEQGKILTPEDFILGQYSILNQAFVIRRINNIDPAEFLGKDFDDTLITLFHLQYGKIVCVNRADYAYVISKGSIDSSLVGIDREVMMFELIPYHILFIPSFAGLLLKAGLKPIKRMMKKTITASQLSPETIKWLEQFPGFSFSMFLQKKLGTKYNIRKIAILFLVQVIDKTGIHFSLAYRILYMLLINSHPTGKFKFNQK